MLIRSFLAGAAVFLLAGGAQAERWDLTFMAYGGGLPLAEGTLHLAIDESGQGDRAGGGAETRYDARLESAGASWINMFAKFHYQAQAAGALKLPAVAPERFRGERSTRKKRDVMMLAYDGADVTVRAEPPLQPEKAALVPEEARRGSVDPLSAGIAVVMAAGGRSACSGTYPVFDGRRRYDVSMTSLGTQVLEPSRRRMAAGPARVCRVALRPVAGFQIDRDKPNAFFAEDKERTATLWFMEVDGRTIPIQVEVVTNFGSFYVHAVGFGRAP